MAEAALEAAWAKYRGWAARSRKIKGELDRWRLWVLVLTVAGAVLGTLASQLADTGANDDAGGGFARLVSGVSAAAMALAAFLSRSMLDPSVEGRWIKARSLAEACKSEAYKFATGVPPYDDNATAGQALLAKLQALLASGADVPALDAIDPEDRRKGLPSRPMSVQAYIEARIDDQVERYYRPRSDVYERRAAWCTRATQALTAIAAVLGAIGAIGDETRIAAWVATLGAISAAVAAFALAKRYEQLTATYRVTADRLDLRLVAWRIIPEAQRDEAAARSLILDAEGILAAENTAWMAEFTSGNAAQPNAATGTTAVGGGGAQ